MTHLPTGRYLSDSELNGFHLYFIERECLDADEIEPDAPLDLTLEYLKNLNIDFVAGNLMSGDSDAAKRYNSQYQEIIDAGMFVNVSRLNGISTTDIIERAVAANSAKVERAA